MHKSEKWLKLQGAWDILCFLPRGNAMRRIILAVLAVAASATLTLCAGTVAWWRFDTIGADGKVVNAANPGTYDGYLTTGTKPGTAGTL